MISLEAGAFVIYAVGQLAGTWWTARRVERIEKMLGNGEEGVFPRRAEVELIALKAAKEVVNGKAL